MEKMIRVLDASNRVFTVYYELFDNGISITSIFNANDEEVNVPIDELQQITADIWEHLRRANKLH